MTRLSLLHLITTLLVMIGMTAYAHAQYITPIGSPYQYNAIRTSTAKPIVTSDTTFAWGVDSYEWVYSLSRQEWYAASHGGFKHDPTRRWSDPVVGRDGLWYYVYRPNEVRSFEPGSGIELTVAEYPRGVRAVARPYLHPSGLIVFALGETYPFGVFWPTQGLCVNLLKDYYQSIDRGILVTRNGTLYYVADREVDLKVRLLKSLDCGVTWTVAALIDDHDVYWAVGPVAIGSCVLFAVNSKTYIYDDERETLDSVSGKLIFDAAVTKGDTAYCATGCTIRHVSRTLWSAPYNMDSSSNCSDIYKDSPFIGQYQPGYLVETHDGRMLVKPHDSTETFSICTASVRPMSIHQVGYDCDTLRLWVNGDLRSSVQWRGYDEAGYTFIGSSESPLRTEYLFRKDRAVPVGPYIVATAGETVDSIRPLLQEPASGCAVNIMKTTRSVSSKTRDVIVLDTSASSPVILVRWYRNGVPVAENYKSYGDDAMYLLEESGEYHVVAMTTTFCTIESNHVVYSATGVDPETEPDDSPVTSISVYALDGRRLAVCGTEQECRDYLAELNDVGLVIILTSHENGRLRVQKHLVR